MKPEMIFRVDPNAFSNVINYYMKTHIHKEFQLEWEKTFQKKRQRWGRLGGNEIEKERVYKNKYKLSKQGSSDNVQHAFHAMPSETNHVDVC